jgi:hypothetical protein
MQEPVCMLLLQLQLLLLRVREQILEIPPLGEK